MTSTTDRSSGDAPARGGRASFLMLPQLWGAVAIAFMWLAVLFDGVYGNDFVSVTPGSSSTTIPSSVFVAFFAFLGSASVAKRAFR